MYKLVGKITVNCYVSLDKRGKIKTLGIIPYQADIKPVTINPDSRKLDMLAHKVLDMIQHNQVDDAYLFAGDVFKSKVNANEWRSSTNGILTFAPMPPAVFIGNSDGVNTYALGIFRISIGSLTKEGKFNTFYFQLYTQKDKKANKVLTDNQLKTRVDSAADKAISPYIQTMGNVGLSAAVFYKGDTYFYNYGERQKGHYNLPDNHTLYDIGSITKTFTSTLLAIAVNQKKVTLETLIAKYLPDSVANNPDLQKITFKQLANHTSGFPRDDLGYRIKVTDANQPLKNYNASDLFKFLKHFKQTTQPGTEYKYSNLAVGLLGVLLERIYQKPFPELVSQYITTPLKMSETGLFVDSLKTKDLAQGYDMFIEPVPYVKLAAIRSAGDIKSSTSDLITYAKAQLSTKESTLNAAFQLTHQVTFDKGNSIVGLVWYYYPDSRNILQHAGATYGYRAAVCIDLNKQIAVAVLTNNASNGNEVGWNLIKAIQEIKN
ncbi:MAG TPA: serine hydrolase domain-containing protein [Mucilaginibacter sp.]